MKISRVISVVDSHTAGEANRVIVSGFPKIRSNSILEMRRILQQEYDYLRRIVILEPRGHEGMFATLLTDPMEEGSDFGLIFMDNRGYENEDLAGHAVIGTIAVAIEIGIVKKVEPVTEVVVDTPIGQLRGRALVDQGGVVEVGFENLPTYVVERDVSISTDTHGRVPVDICFGGQLNAVVDADRLNLSITPQNMKAIISAAVDIQTAINRQSKVRVQQFPHMQRVNDIVVNERVDSRTVRTMDIGGIGALDRSPCGTGTCSTLTVLHDRGELGLNETLITESVIGSRFKGRLLKETQLDGNVAVVPEVTGSAFITGYNTLVVDERDALGGGFTFGEGGD